MAGINDLIKVNFDIKIVNSSPEIWRKILLIGTTDTGMPDGFGTIGGEKQLTKEVSSIEDLDDLGISKNSIVYKTFETFKQNCDDSLILGLVDNTISEIPEGENDPVERDDFKTSLNNIYNQNSNFYGVFPIYIDTKSAYEIKKTNQDVAEWCASHIAIAKLQTREPNDLLQETTDDIASVLKAESNNSCYIDVDLANTENKFASIANFTKAIFSTRGQYDLSWKKDFVGYEVSKLTRMQESVADDKNISYYKLCEDNLNAYFFGKTPLGMSACVKMDVDYATLKIKQALTSFFRNSDKVPNNMATQQVIENTIKEVYKQMLGEGVFEKTTRQDIADKYFSGDVSKVKGWDEGNGCALYMPDITVPNNVVDGIYKGIILYVRINGVIYGLNVNCKGIINV